MMYGEFEELAGYEVSYKDYVEIIEPMYMATDLSKQDFIACLNKERFALPTERQIINKMKAEVKKLYAAWGVYSDLEATKALEQFAHEYKNRFWSGERYWYYFHNEYEYANMRGCALPTEFIITSDHGEVKRIKLIDLDKVA